MPTNMPPATPNSDRRDLENGLLQVLKRCGELLSFNPGESLFRQEETATGIFVITEGKVELWVASGLRKVSVQVVGAGEVLGFAAVLSGGVCPITATALELTSARFVRREQLLE